jgi:acyl-CoA reductase-like NAD-dependent aldehyde dehydrogenase
LIAASTPAFFPAAISTPREGGNCDMAIVKPLETGPGGRRRLQLLSPATLDPIGTIDCMTAEDVRAMVAKARQAQPGWAALTFEQRGAYMLKALEILLARQDEFIKVIEREGPKPRLDVVQMDIFPVCDALGFYARHAATFLQTQKVELHGVLAMTKDLYIMYKPMGVAAIISPWNGPFVLAIVPAIQALMAGNTVVVKPSSVTPMSGKLVEDLFKMAGVPEGVVSVVIGDSQSGQALLEADIDKVTFTGSVSVGRHVAKTCAERLIPCTLELGGKDAMIVCADANLDNAAGGAVAGCFINTGQYCCGTERVYVVESVAEAFTQKVVERTSKLRQATAGDFDVGTLFTPDQLETVEQHVADAVAKGAKVLIGGRRNPSLKGLYYEPTVLVNVNHDMLVMTEETFGPVMPIMPVKDEEEAIRLTNDSVYGLSSSVWTENIEKGLELARRVSSGSCNINDMAVTFGVCEAPFGGVRHSGIGRSNGEYGLKGYCNVHPVIVDKLSGSVTAEMYPTSLEKARLMQDTCRAIFGTGSGS